MRGELGSFRLIPAERGEAPTHAGDPPGHPSNEPHTWHVPGPPENPDQALPRCPSSSQPLSPTPGDIPTLGSREEGCGEEMGLRPGAKLSTPGDPAPLSPKMSLCKAGRARSSQKDAECSGKQELPTPSFPYSPASRSGMSQILKTKSSPAALSATGFEIHGLKCIPHSLMSPGGAGCAASTLVLLIWGWAGGTAPPHCLLLPSVVSTESNHQPTWLLEILQDGPSSMLGV